MTQSVETDAKAGRVCPDCGYDLRGTDGGRCPECGLAQDGAEAFVIPWQQRKEIGRLMAFLRTVEMAVVRPRRLAMAIAAPVEYASAERFRRWVVVLASLPPIVFFLAVVWHMGGTGFLAVTDGRRTSLESWLADPWSEMAVVWSAGAMFVLVLPAGVAMMFYLATGAAGYWFRPAHLDVERQNRAVAISRYACGPLALLPLPAVLAAGFAGMVAEGFSDAPPWPWGWVMLVGLVGAILAAGWRASLVLLARTTHCGGGRVIGAGFGLPLSWLLAAVVGLGAFPFAVGLIWIVVDSFR